MSTLMLTLALLGQSGYQSTPLSVVYRALTIAEVGPQDTVLDIGCGDGRVCVVAAKVYGAKAVGLELDSRLGALARSVAARNYVKDLVEVRIGDALEASLGAPTVVYLYHQREFLDRLRPRLLSLPVGTRIIYHDYLPTALAGVLEPLGTVLAEGHEHRIYVEEIAPACGTVETPLVQAGMRFDGARFYEGLRSERLASLAEDCVDLMLARGVRGYYADGHPDWDRRFRIIREEMGLEGKEVTAFSYRSTEQDKIRGLFKNWRGSNGHWQVVSSVPKFYGESVKLRDGVWYACIIVAN